METTIQISGLSKSYAGNKVIKNLSLSVAAGEVYGLLGANGAGKSTTIECMKTASVIASILYFPMLIFSGATLPYEVMPSALQKAADILPLTQGIKMLKAASLGFPLESVWISIVIMFAFMIICGGIAVRFFKWE